MRYLKPHFYDQFVCTAGDCPDTCCAGWQIVIDEDSLERYGNEKSEFAKSRCAFWRRRPTRRMILKSLTS